MSGARTCLMVFNICLLSRNFSCTFLSVFIYLVYIIFWDNEMKKNFLFFIWMLPLVFLSVCSARNNEWPFLSHFIYIICYFASLHHSSLQISKLLSCSLFGFIICGRLFFSWPPLPAFSRPLLALVELRYVHCAINQDFSFLLSALPGISPEQEIPVTPDTSWGSPRPNWCCTWLG